MDKSDKKKKRRFDPDLLKKGLRCDLDQYEMLKRCSEKKDTTEWNEWRTKNPTEPILLEGADFLIYDKEQNKTVGYLAKADLIEANLKYATLVHTDLRNASLSHSHLEHACIQKARLEGTDLQGAHLESSDFKLAIVDGSTLFWKCKVDRHTDFRGVGLDSARMDAGTRQLLKYNIRRMNWEDWYKEYWFWQWPFRLFWFLNNYGMSGKRVVGIFFLLALLFAAIYSSLGCWLPPGIVSGLEVEPHLPLWRYGFVVFVRPVYFSIVTMTTLGFGDMYANAQSIWGHILLMVQVILGYVILGALVTRFAVLFTAGGPAGKFEGQKKKLDSVSRTE